MRSNDLLGVCGGKGRWVGVQINWDWDVYGGMWRCAVGWEGLTLENTRYSNGFRIVGVGWSGGDVAGLGKDWDNGENRQLLLLAEKCFWLFGFW